MYELTYIFSPKIDEKEVAEKSREIEETIIKTGGKILSQKGETNLKTLAYPIKHFDKGYFRITQFELPAKRIKKLSTKLRLEGNVIRFLITKATKSKPVSAKKIPPVKKSKKAEIPVLETKKEKEPRPKKEKQKEPTKRKKIKIEELDKKLEEILNEKII